MAEGGARRLVGGAADPGGAWQYGRLEVAERGLWTPVWDRMAFGSSDVVDACAALGFTAGAQITVDGLSPLAEDLGFFEFTFRDVVLLCSKPSGVP